MALERTTISVVMDEVFWKLLDHTYQVVKLKAKKRKVAPPSLSQFVGSILTLFFRENYETLLTEHTEASLEKVQKQLTKNFTIEELSILGASKLSEIGRDGLSKDLPASGATIEKK